MKDIISIQEPFGIGDTGQSIDVNIETQIKGLIDQTNNSIEYPYASVDDSYKELRFSKTNDFSTTVLGFTLNSLVQRGHWVYDGLHVYSMIITGTTVAIYRQKMFTGGASVNSYSFDAGIDISSKMEYYYKYGRIWVFYQSGSTIYFRILSRDLILIYSGTLQARVGMTIDLLDIGRGIIDVSEAGIWVAVKNTTRGLMDYCLYDFSGNFIKTVRETSISVASASDYVNIMCFQDGKVGLYEADAGVGYNYIYDREGNYLSYRHSFNAVNIQPANGFMRFGVMISRAGANSVQEFNSNGVVGSSTYSYGRWGVYKAF